MTWKAGLSEDLRVIFLVKNPVNDLKYNLIICGYLLN